MRPLRVIVLNELAHQVIEVLRATRNEVIETFRLKRLDEPLGVRSEEGPHSRRSDTDCIGAEMPIT
jgi:hypothetical protein